MHHTNNRHGCPSLGAPRNANGRPGSAEREEELLAFALAEALEDGVLDGGDLDAALLARDEHLVEQREHVALLVDARGEHPAQHRAVHLQLLEAAAPERREARLP